MSINKGHGKNKDKYLDKNGVNECAAADIRLHLDTVITPVSVGLGNVDNTADINKPVSLPTQDALNTKYSTIEDITNIDRILLNFNEGSGAVTVDATGNYSGFVFNNNATISSAQKKFGVSALSLPSNDDYMYLSNLNLDILASNTESWTIQGFFYHNGGDTDARKLFCLGDVTGNDTLYVQYDTNLTRTRMYMIVGGVHYLSIINSIPSPNTWNHLAVAVVGNGSTKNVGLYINGAQVAYKAVPNAGGTLGYLTLGTHRVGGSFDYSSIKGNIDGFRIENNNSLNASPNSGGDTIVVPATELVKLDTSDKVMGVTGTGDIARGEATLAEVNDTVSGLAVRVDTLDRDALSPINGRIIYNTDVNKFQGYENGVWVNLI